MAMRDTVQMDGEKSTTRRIEVCLARIRNGDNEARDELLKRARHRLEKIARRDIARFPIVDRWDDFETLVQEALLSLSKAMDAMEFQSTQHYLAIGAKMIRQELIVLNRFYKRKKRNVHRVDTNLQKDGAVRRDGGEVDSNVEAPDARSQEAELRLTLHDAVEKLPDNLRVVVDLHFYQGIPLKEIATDLKIDYEAVKKRFQRAKMSLAKSLKPQDL